jgi:hypothetical protein
MKFLIGNHSRVKIVVLGVIAALLSGMPLASTIALAAERPVAPEKNPPGDIPDSQTFVTYVSPLGLSLQVPEGWARTDRSDGTRFADKYNAIDAAVTPAAATPTASSVTDHEATALVKGGRAVKIDSIRTVKLLAGVAIRIAYSSNSEPNTVTGKQLRLEHHRYLIYRSGRLATIDLAAPLGADNADQWNHIANSFRWQ